MLLQCKYNRENRENKIIDQKQNKKCKTKYFIILIIHSKIIHFFAIFNTI